MSLEVRVAASPLSHPEGTRTRVGLVVPRFKHSAVARNRLKRRLRELARLHLLPADVPVDVVLRTRPETYGATFERLESDVRRALSELTRWRASAREPEARDPGTDPPMMNSASTVPSR
jgi:ribonuclease P protein component